MIDRDALIDAIETWTKNDDFDSYGLLADRILALVRSTPPQGIDRDALLVAIAKAIDEHYEEEDYRPVYSEQGEIVDSAAARVVLALVRPVEGVVLTPEEADTARRVLSGYAKAFPNDERLVSLAARLEALR